MLLPSSTRSGRRARTDAARQSRPPGSVQRFGADAPPLRIEVDALDDRAAKRETVVHNRHGADANENLAQLEMELRCGGEAIAPIATDRLFAPELAARHTQALDDQGAGHLEVVGVVGQNASEVMRVPRGDPVAGKRLGPGAIDHSWLPFIAAGP